MITFEIGDFIKKNRKQRGITQEQLAHPFMDRSHISKIERGLVMPDKNTLTTLLERLGITLEAFPAFFLDSEEAVFQQGLDEINSHLARGRSNEAEKMIAQLEQAKYAQSLLYRQRFLLYKCIWQLQQQKDLDQAQAYVLEAIRLTIPTFDEEKVSAYLLSKQDVHCLNNLVAIYCMQGDLKRGIRLLYQLKANYDGRFMDASAKRGVYSLIVYNLAKALAESNKCAESIGICQTGRQACLDLADLEMLPSIVTIEATCLYELGQVVEAEALFRQAYYGFEMYGKFEEQAVVREYAKKRGIFLE